MEASRSNWIGSESGRHRNRCYMRMRCWHTQRGRSGELLSEDPILPKAVKGVEPGVIRTGSSQMGDYVSRLPIVFGFSLRPASSLGSR
jgi:hypothetical protein